MVGVFFILAGALVGYVLSELAMSSWRDDDDY